MILPAVALLILGSLMGSEIWKRETFKPRLQASDVIAFVLMADALFIACWLVASLAGII